MQFFELIFDSSDLTKFINPLLIAEVEIYGVSPTSNLSIAFPRTFFISKISSILNSFHSTLSKVSLLI